MKNRLEKSIRRSVVAIIAPGIFVALAVGCAQLCLAAQPAQTTFPSAEAGSHALFLAVQHHDEPALTKILGAGEELVSSDDAAQDELDRQQFVEKYQEMHRLARDPDGDTILYVGPENWPFPIPLVSRDGVWRFDADAGQQEVLLRRIGENEVSAIEVCRELVSAGPTTAVGERTDSTIAALRTELDSNKSPVLFQAYEFRILTGPGQTVPSDNRRWLRGGAVIAYPAAYRSSGVMTFVVSQDGVVYQKDLGPDTPQRATAMTALQLDSSWTPAPTEP